METICVWEREFVTLRCAKSKERERERKNNAKLLIMYALHIRSMHWCVLRTKRECMCGWLRILKMPGFFCRSLKEKHMWVSECRCVLRLCFNNIQVNHVCVVIEAKTTDTWTDRQIVPSVRLAVCPVHPSVGLSTNTTTKTLFKIKTQATLT